MEKAVVYSLGKYKSAVLYLVARAIQNISILRFHCHAINTSQKNTFETVQWKKPRK